MPRHELARLKLMRQPMRSRVAQIVQPCEKSGLDNWAATIREVASSPPPAAIGQMMRTSWVGQV